MIRKLLCLLVALVIVLGMLPALALAESDKVPLTLFVNSSGAAIDKWGSDDISIIIEDKTGVKLTLEKPASDDNQKINLMLASNQKLPDMIFVEKANPVYAQMIKDELIYSLDELIDAYDPSFKELPLYVTDWDYMKYDDGMTYFVPAWWNERGKLDKDVFILGRSGYYVRKDLYEELGSPKLTTLDDMKSLLIAAKQKYPDLRPLMMWNNANDQKNDGFDAAYYSLGGEGPYYMDGDQVKVYVRDPLFLEAGKFISSLYREGLFNKSDFTDTVDQQLVYNRNGKLFMAAGQVFRSAESDGALSEAVPGAGYLPINYLKKSDDAPDVLMPASLGAPWAGLVVTKDCTDPAAALQFIKYLCTDEGQALQLVGMQGQHWDWVEQEKALVQIDDYAELINDWNAWADVTGGYKYVWCGGSFYDSAFAWGLAKDNEIRRQVYALETQVRDYTAYDGLIPTDDSPEAVIYQKYEELRMRYIARMCLGASDEEVEQVYTEFLSALDSLGMAQLEAQWTAKYAENIR